jgi:hypothetical protein
MLPRTRSVATLCLAVAVGGACGGKASQRDRNSEFEGAPDPESVQAPDPESVQAPDPESVQAPAEELPGSLEVLELRLSDDPDAPLTGKFACLPDGYSLRYKVNFEVNLLVQAACKSTGDTVGGSLQSVKLLDSDIAQVQAAYAALSISSAEQCATAPGVLTLDLTPKHGTHLLYGDEEHSGCPSPGMQRDTYLAGLDGLYSLLESLAAR